MTRVLMVLLLLGSAAIGVWLWSAFALPLPFGDAATTASPPMPSAPRTAIRDDGQRRRDEVTMILARPVFSATRRPKEDAAGPTPAAAPITALPRMSAILIDGTRRSAIFDGNGKPTVIAEGGHLGPFIIQSIEPQQVTIIGPEGKRIVRTSFSNEPPPAMPLPPGLMPPLPVILPPGMAPNLPNLGPSR